MFGHRALKVKKMFNVIFLWSPEQTIVLAYYLYFAVGSMAAISEQLEPWFGFI